MGVLLGFIVGFIVYCFLAKILLIPVNIAVKRETAEWRRKVNNH